MYHHINQPRKRVDVVEMGKNVCKKVEMGEQGEHPKMPDPQCIKTYDQNNNDAQNTTKYGFLLRPGA